MKTALDHYFDEGWKEFIKAEREKAKVSNERMYRLLTAIKGEEFVRQLRKYKDDLRAKHATVHARRKPTGVRVVERRSALITEVWVHQGRSELGKYTRICIQIKPDRWVSFIA